MRPFTRSCLHRAVRGIAAASLLLTFPGCGPVVIGVGLSSAGGGGGGGPAEPGPVTAGLGADSLQPFDDQTLVAFTLAQETGRGARLRFEYDVGQGRQPLAADQIVRYDSAAATTATPLPRDGGGNYLCPTSAGGARYEFLWNHAATLGNVEQRGVSLYAVFALEERSDDSLANTTGGGTIQLIANATVGRELSELTGLALARESTSPESAFVLTATLLDRGGDRARTDFRLRYALNAPPVEADFVELPPLTPTAVVDSEDPDGRQRSQLTFKFEPLAVNVPIGAFPFTLAVQQIESYSLERDNVPPVVKIGATQQLQLANTQVGFQPVIESARVVDPSSSESNFGDANKPWLRLPIALRVFNPSPTLPATLRVRGRYTLGGQTAAITPFVDGDPLSALEFTLQPLQRERHYLVWNVVRDEGLGNTLQNLPPYSPLRTAEVEVEVELIAAGTATLGGAPLIDTANAGFTALNTTPFVDFRDNLEPQANRIWSSGSRLTNKTRDLFFTQLGGSNQETRVFIDQQFEPVQIVPPPPVYDYFPGFTNGVFDIVATDFEPGVPDCLVWINGVFRFMTWPDSSGAVVENLPPVGGTLNSRGRDPISFRLTAGGSSYDVATFFTWSEATVGGNKDVSVRLTSVVRNPNMTWSVVTGSTDTFQIAGTPGVNISAVGGEFDGNPDTYEYVLGTFGSENAGSGRPGLLHMWTFSIVGGNLQTTGPVALPIAPPLPGSASRPVSQWLLAAWDDGVTGRDGLVLVRQLDGTPPPQSLDRQLDVYTLIPSAAGSLTSASWSLLTDGLTAAASGFPQIGNTQLRKIFTEDLDGPNGGIDGSDLVLVFDEAVFPNRYADIWLFAARGNGSSEWRRVLRRLQVIDPVTLQPITGEMECSQFQLVDVNGDRLRDLVTCEAVGTLSASTRHYNYLASSLSGVAGKISSLGNSAGADTYRSILPGLLDVNEDGLTDVITGSRLHIANLDGTFTQLSGDFPGGPEGRQVVERVWLDGPPDAVEIVVSNRSESSQNKIQRLGGIGTQSYSSQLMLDYGSSLGGSGGVQQLRALMAPDSETRQVKDLVGLVGTGATAELRRGRIDTTSMTVAGSQLWNGTVRVPAGIALVRRGALASGNLAENRNVQDVAVVDDAQPGQIVVLSAAAGYAAATLALPAGEQAVRIAAASVTTDTLEDLCVITQGSGVYHLRVFAQTAGGYAATTTELARFAQPFANAAVRSFQFDAGATSLANGFLLIDDESAASTRSEARIVRPILDSGNVLGSRIVRSPLDQPVDVDVETVVTDADRDGLIEVVGGEPATSNGLKRLRTNIAPPN